jgi:predicted Zn-dependent peptidase
MWMLTLALAAAAAGADSVPARPAAAVQQVVLVHRQPAVPVVALRVSLLADDPPGHAGAGHLFQHLHLAAFRESVARVGGRVQAVRTSDAVVYTAVGPAAELDHLAEALLAVLRVPVPATAEMLRALAELAEERAMERETAPAYVRAALRAHLFPRDLSPAGTDAGAARLASAPLEEIWGAMYRPERVSVVAVGDVEPAAVRRAFAALPQPPSTGVRATAADTARSPAAHTPQATRGWTARGWAAHDEDPAVVTVAARMLRDDLRRRMTQSAVEVEHWWTHQGQAVVVVVATPGSLLPAARRTASGAVESLRGRVDDRSVRHAAAAVRRDMLFFSRTPERMAEVIGAFADRGGTGDAAQRFYAEVDRVSAADVRAVLSRLAASDPATVEVAPQALRR